MVIDSYTSEILDKDFLQTYAIKQPKFGFDALGYVVYKRTYARLLNDGLNTEEWWQTIARCINGAQKIGACYTKEEAERLYDHIFNFRCTFAGRMLWQLGTSTVDRFGANSLLNCFSYETEVITREGIKRIGDIKDQTVSLMSDYGKYISSEIKSFGKQKLVKLVLNRNGIKKEIYTTENHKWFRRARRTKDERHLNNRIECITTELKKNDKLWSVYGQSVKSISSISKYGIISGLVFGDGSVCNNVGQLTLCGSKNLELLKYFVEDKKYTLKNGDICIANLPKYFKQKPALDMDKPYLYGWLAGYFAADGCVDERGKISMSSANKDNLLFVRDVCVRLGIGYCPITTNRRIGIGQTEESELYSITLQGSYLTEDFFLLSKHKERFLAKQNTNTYDWRVVSVEETNRFEEVYCAVVPETHSFALEGNILTGNCWTIAMRDIDAFCFLFENLMLGGGVGFSVRREDIHELPKVKKSVIVTHKNTKDSDFIVPDSREGWVKLLREVLEAFLVSGKSFTYSTILVRGAGERINGFGGVSSGPSILVKGIENICTILSRREGKKLRSIDVLDICNIIGSVVVSGNVRRSAELAMGDPDDFLFLRAKRWDLGGIPSWRGMSNNTIYADNYDQISNSVWETYSGNGEALGFFNLPLAQRYGRVGDEIKDSCFMLNPCGEIAMENGECCNLSDLFFNNLNTKEEAIDCARLLYKTQKAICALPFIHDITNNVVHKNMRIGVGITGICQSLDKIEWMSDIYRELRSFDEEWSRIRGWNRSIKLTTIKPSGSVSILAGATPGIHPGYSRFYIRRIRVAANDALVDTCRDAGYHIEFSKNIDGSFSHDTVIISFPIRLDDRALVSKDMSAIKQLELVKEVQRKWADNAVSVTVYYKKEELEEIKEWMKNNYEDNIKSVSFLLHSDHGFMQAPYEEIDEKTYNGYMKKIKPISTITTSGDIDDIECAGGVCPIK